MPNNFIVHQNIKTLTRDYPCHINDSIIFTPQKNNPPASVPVNKNVNSLPFKLQKIL